MKSATYKELSYLIGMIMADGTFSGKTWRVVQSNEEYLLLLQQIFGGKVEINRQIEGYKLGYQLRFNREDSDWITTNFPALNKDKNLLYVPENVDFYSFLLGLLDGDGSITLKPNGRLNGVTFLVRESLGLSLLQEFAKIDWHPRYYAVKLRGNRKVLMFTVCFHTNIAYSLLKELYAASPVWLKRKKDTFEKIEIFKPKNPCINTRKNKCDSCGKKSVSRLCRVCLTEDKILQATEMKNQGISISQISKNLNISSAAAWHLAHGGRRAKSTGTIAELD